MRSARFETALKCVWDDVCIWDKNRELDQKHNEGCDSEIKLSNGF